MTLKATVVSPRLLTADAIAQRWSVSRRAVYRLLERDELPSIVIGERCVRVPIEAVERYESERLRV